jgi:WD40 repeat protein
MTAGKSDTPAFTINEAHENYISCIGVSPDGAALCTGSWDYNLKVSFDSTHLPFVCNTALISRILFNSFTGLGISRVTTESL